MKRFIQAALLILFMTLAPSSLVLAGDHSGGEKTEKSDSGSIEKQKAMREAYVKKLTDKGIDISGLPANITDPSAVTEGEFWTKIKPYLNQIERKERTDIYEKLKTKGLDVSTLANYLDPATASGDKFWNEAKRLNSQYESQERAKWENKEKPRTDEKAKVEPRPEAKAPPVSALSAAARKTFETKIASLDAAALERLAAKLKSRIEAAKNKTVKMKYYEMLKIVIDKAESLDTPSDDELVNEVTKD